MAEQRARRLYVSIQQLRNIGPKSNAPIKFIVDTTPFDDDNEPSTSGDWIITGRLLPNSNIYKEGSIPIRIVMEPTFPFQPPKVFSLIPLYHPNVDKNGEICTDLSTTTGTWTATTTLLTVIEIATKIIDEPSIDNIKYPEAADLFKTDRSKYNQKVSELYKTHCGSRT